MDCGGNRLLCHAVPACLQSIPVDLVMKQTLDDLHERMLIIENLLGATGVNALPLQASGDPDQFLKRNLKLAMMAKNVRPSQLARSSGVCEQTICDWQSGIVPRGLVNLKKVANALGITVDQLVFGGEE